MKISSREYRSDWAEARMSEWNIWKEKGNEPRYDDKIVEELTSTIYDKKYQNMMDGWDREKFVEFREHIVELTFETVYFPEAVFYLENWNIKFSNK